MRIGIPQAIGISPEGVGYVSRVQREMTRHFFGRGLNTSRRPFIPRLFDLVLES